MGRTDASGPDRAAILIRPLSPEELPRAVEIDVGEAGTSVYEQAGTALMTRAETWRRPSRTEVEWAAFVSRWRDFIPDGGAALGAFQDGALIGIATIHYDVRPHTAQLEALFVDRAHRRLGVAAALVSGIERLAVASGARRLYVSATPSESAVGFYRARGFRPTRQTISELLELEPEDIHMDLRLDLASPPAPSSVADHPDRGDRRAQPSDGRVA
jgi:GNAT superfamily N-acetyltransferase